MATSLTEAISRSKHYNDGTKDFNTIIKDGSTSPFFSKTTDASALNNWTGYYYLGSSEITNVSLNTTGDTFKLPAENISAITGSTFKYGTHRLVGGSSQGIFNVVGKSPKFSLESVSSDNNYTWCSIGWSDTNAPIYEITVNASTNDTSVNRKVKVHIGDNDNYSLYSFYVNQDAKANMYIPLFVRFRVPYMYNEFKNTYQNYNIGLRYNVDLNLGGQKYNANAYMIYSGDGDEMYMNSSTCFLRKDEYAFNVTSIPTYLGDADVKYEIAVSNLSGYDPSGNVDMLQTTVGLYYSSNNINASTLENLGHGDIPSSVAQIISSQRYTTHGVGAWNVEMNDFLTDYVSDDSSLYGSIYEHSVQSDAACIILDIKVNGFA